MKGVKFYFCLVTLAELCALAKSLRLIGMVSWMAVFRTGINWAYFALGVGAFGGLIFYAVRRANRGK